MLNALLINMLENKNIFYASLILSLSLIIAAGIWSLSFYRARTFDTLDTLEVTGSTKQKITSDTVRWVAGSTRTVPVGELKQGCAEMTSDQKIVEEFLKENGMSEGGFKFSPVFIEERNPYDFSQPREYILKQSVEINSSEVEKITQIAKNLQPVVEKGAIFSTQSLEYYYSKLPELRINLISDATKDAKVRAEQIVEATGKKVGSLKSASLGVTQVLPINSVEISDYGTYDTSSIEKEVMVTVRTVFRLK